MMPMSDIPGVASKAEWNSVYDKLFVPSITKAGFEAIRSEANRGNIVADIIDNLWSADAVIADLTGQKPNVFYELGVRHALQGKTIIIARRRNDIPFDLQGYARHIYNPKSLRGRKNFRNVIKHLLQDIIKFPDRRDNPVEDFLRDSKRLHSAMRLPHLFPPQRRAYLEQMARCEQSVEDICRGQVPVPSGTAEYFNYFMELVNSGNSCESIRVFLTTMRDDSIRYDQVAVKQLFAPFKRAVRREKMRIEYMCLFKSRAHYAAVNGGAMLDRHRQFAYSVRKVFLDEIQSQLLQTEKTIVLFETRKWAITHTWNTEGVIENPTLSLEPRVFELLRRQYRSIRSLSHPYRHRT